MRVGAACVVVLACCTGACSHDVKRSRSATTTTSNAPPLRPPMLDESFDPLPCDANTTVGRMGCAERAVLEVDQQIDQAVADVFAHLSSDDARRRFVTAEASWRRYRDETCA